MAIATVNPATGETLKTFEPLTDTELESKLDRADRAFGVYRLTSLAERAAWLRAAADIVETQSDRFARIITLEMGKPISQAIAEVKKCALVCRYYADRGSEFLADRPIDTDAKTSYVRYQAIGPVLAVMPWNFPFWQVFRFAAPAFMVGNVGLLKHASNVPQCAIAIEEIFQEAGFPTGTFQTLLVGSDKVEKIVSDDRVKAATLTGSEAAGSSLAAIAGKYIKKTVLELGGSDPYIVLPSADLDKAAATAVTARTLNSGQSCIAAKRFILADAIADEFQSRFVEKLQGLKMGDPTQEDTDIGPLATPGIRDELHSLVRQCISKGATALIGGELPDGPGNFYPPTAIADIPPGTPADSEEFFGPVALLFRVPNLEAAITLANRVPLGLGASVWTQVEAEADRAINRLESGSVFVNGMVKSDPRLPFGGVKKSGYGRELGIQGIHEFANVKTIWVGE